MPKDNTFGRGYVPLPAGLSHLGRFVTSLHPAKLLDHKVFVDEGVHMLVAKVDPRLSILAMDMKSLLRLGLVRIQCNDLGTLSFYFREQLANEAVEMTASERVANRFTDNGK